jgi:plastocyanin
MDTTMPQSDARHRQPLAALGKLTIGALLGSAGLLVFAQVVSIGKLHPALTAIAVIMVIIAGVIATGRRWGPLLAAGWYVIYLGLEASRLAFALTHPADRSTFDGRAVDLTLAVLGIIVGIAAAAQNYRVSADTERRAPRMLTPTVAGLAGLCLGAILATLPPPAQAQEGGVSPATLSTLPAITAVGRAFDHTELRARVGETVALRLENRDNQGHSFDIDEFDVHVAMLPGKHSLALFKPSRVGTYTFYCSVPGHRAEGMSGALVVTP